MCVNRLISTVHKGAGGKMLADWSDQSDAFCTPPLVFPEFTFPDANLLSASFRLR